MKNYKTTEKKWEKKMKEKEPLHERKDFTSDRKDIL